MEAIERRRFLAKSLCLAFGALTGLPFLRALPAAASQGRSPLWYPQLALIIDDIGYSREHADRFLALQIPLTFSVLPRLPYSAELAAVIHSEGHEVMLHQPMEPYNRRIDPGPGALFVDDGPERIDRIMEENIEAFPFAIGVNNHMGSRFTEHRPGIYEALQIIKRNRLFFVDSLTTHRSQAFRVARQLHMPAAARNVFLDIHPSPAAIDQQLQRLVRHAERSGRAIGIGHPRHETAKAIAAFLPRLKRSPVSLVPVSRIIRS